MTKYTYKSSFLAAMILIICLSLSACVKVDNVDQLKELQSQNQALQSELASLKASLADEKVAKPSVPAQSETSTSAPSGLVAGNQTAAKPSKSPSEEDEFVYRGDLEVNGKRVADMSREEIEALPTMGTPVTDAKTGQTTILYPPEGIKNLYEQLEYVDRVNRFMASGPEVKEEKTVELGAYDISDKALLVHHKRAENLDLVSELEGKKQEELTQWIQANLTDPVSEKPANFSYDTQIFAAQGDHLFLNQADFLEVQDKPYANLMNAQGDFFQIDLKSEAALKLRDILAVAQQKVIYDEAAKYAHSSEQKPLNTLSIVASQKADNQEISFRVVNDQEENWAFRNYYRLYYYDGESWFHMEPTMVGECYEPREDLILPGEERVLTIHYGSCYGQLPTGYYRIELGLEAQQDEQEGSALTANSQRENYAIYFVIR